ncbi:MAG: hypothetical protein IJR49_05275, partial [Treponema sp.]|nr:hypothetical protein [Treponema sp.]
MRFFLCVCISFVFFACSQNASSNTAESYGDNSFYYLALRSLSSGDEKEAHRLFTLGSQKGSGYIARKCFEELTLLGGVQQRLVASKNLIEKYGDEDAILVACRQYDASGEYTKIIVAAEKTDLSTCNGELAKIYLTALAKIESKKFLDEAYRCFSSRPINEHLYVLYREVLSDEGEIENILNESNLSFQNTKSKKIDAKISAQKKIINFRIDVYLKNYKAAYEKLNEILSLASTQTSKGSENEGLTLTAQLVSDMGKTCLYGSSNNARNAARFENLSRGSSDNEIIFYSSFYAGRLYEKAGLSFENVSSHFLKAMDFAPNEEKHDNALWYLLNSAMRSSTDILIQSLQKYCKTWKDPSYFDDMFELLVSRLLAQERWNDFGLIYKTVDSYASDEVVSQYAYIYARLLQEELASANNKNRTIEDAFTRALSSGTNVYYKALAISYLNLDYDESVRKMSETKINQNFKKNEEAERLLLGYAVFGIPEKIYPEWRNLVYEKKIDISLDCACALADFLNHVSNKTDDYYMQALRIMAKTANFCETNLTEKA